jgi:holo-[acyl-carrier protein] synthase
MAQPFAEHMSPSALRVGVDLVRVADVVSSIARFGDRYASRIFTASERAYCAAGDAVAGERFAARFAAKEATIKVLRPAPDETLAWSSIEVRPLAEGACEIVLHDEALALARRAGVAQLSLSMSHEQEYATATVVAWLAPTSEVVDDHRWNTVHATPPASWHGQTSWDA